MAKGIVYTIMTTFIILTIMSFIMAYLLVTQSHGESVFRKIQSDSLQYYTASIDLDMPRAINIVGKRSLAVAVIEVSVNGSGLDDAKRRVEELMTNHTLYGRNASLMGNDSLTQWAENVEKIGNEYGFSVNISLNALSVKPYDSFRSVMHANISVHISNYDQSINVSRNYSHSVITTYFGLDDPMYTLHTGGFVTRKIFRNNETVRNVQTVDRATENKFYMGSFRGASFFDRLEGRLFLSDRYASMSAQQIGMESFADLQEISNKGLAVRQNQTCVDYLYFNSTDMQGFSLAGSANPWLKIDPPNAVIYNVTANLLPY